MASAITLDMVRRSIEDYKEADAAEKVATERRRSAEKVVQMLLERYARECAEERGVREGYVIELTGGEWVKVVSFFGYSTEDGPELRMVVYPQGSRGKYLESKRYSIDVKTLDRRLVSIQSTGMLYAAKRARKGIREN